MDCLGIAVTTTDTASLLLKRCIKCKVEKPVMDFYPKTSDPTKPRSECKKCHYRPHSKKKWDYGLSQEQYEEMLREQGGHCVLCEETQGLEVDHDPLCCPTRPVCGKCVRGLLCDRHNRGLGFFTPEELEMALEYIRRKL